MLREIWAAAAEWWAPSSTRLRGLAREEELTGNLSAKRGIIKGRVGLPGPHVVTPQTWRALAPRGTRAFFVVDDYWTIHHTAYYNQDVY